MPFRCGWHPRNDEPGRSLSRPSAVRYLHGSGNKLCAAFLFRLCKFHFMIMKFYIKIAVPAGFHCTNIKPEKSYRETPTLEERLNLKTQLNLLYKFESMK